MTNRDNIKLYEDKKVRAVWDEDKECWWFSVVDVVGILSDSVDPTAYWRKLKQRLKEEGNETVTNGHGLKMKAVDGKMRLLPVILQLNNKQIEKHLEILIFYVDFKVFI